MATGRLPDPNTAPVTAKGDLYTYSTVPAKLAVGNNGETLVADSSTSTGLRWQANQAAGRNFLLNGSYDVWQRGTSFAGGATTNYTADRWIGYRGAAGSTFSRQTTGDSTNLPNIQYCIRVARDSGNTSTSTIQLVQPIETINSIPLAGQTVTFSFWARRGANYSGASNNLNVLVQTGTGTDQNNAGGFTGSVSVIDTTATLTTTWTRYQFTATLSSTLTQVGVQLYYVPSGTAGAADYFEATGLQLERGSIATAFIRAAGTLAGELAACQRYYFRTNASASTFAVFANGWAITTTAAKVSLPYPVQMRTKVTSLENGGTIVVTDDQNAYTPTSYSMDANNNNSNMAVITANVSSGLTQYRPMMIRASNDSTAYLGFSAEL